MGSTTSTREPSAAAKTTGTTSPLDAAGSTSGAAWTSAPETTSLTREVVACRTPVAAVPVALSRLPSGAVKPMTSMSPPLSGTAGSRVPTSAKSRVTTHECARPNVTMLSAASTCGSVPVRSRCTVPSATVAVTTTRSGTSLTPSLSR
jgi:hypothetical protein